MDNNDSLRGRLRSDLSDKGWWYGAIGGVLSTVIGIALTFGVSAWVSNRNDRREARAMMFNVVMTCEDHMDFVHHFDSIYGMQKASIDTLVVMYRKSDKFTKDYSKETLTRCLQRVVMFGWGASNNPLNKFFFSAQMMNQFGNTRLYKVFADFVEFDRITFARLEEYSSENERLLTIFSSKIDYCGEHPEVVIAEMIENGQLPSFAIKENLLMLSGSEREYKEFYDMMLKAMGATEEEYEDFKKENSTVVDSYYSKDNNKDKK